MESTQRTSIRVVVADDHPIVRLGIHNELSRHPDIRIVGEAVNGDEALAQARALKPDVLVLDVNMPGLKAIKVARQLREYPDSPRVLVLTVCDDEEHVVAMLAAGVRGYLLKDEAPATIAEAVRAVACGALWLSSGVATCVESAVENAPEKTLTPREKQVLQMIARGWDNKKIAQALSVTEATVKFHITHIYDKLGVTSRVEAVLCAAHRALVDLDG